MNPQFESRVEEIVENLRKINRGELGEAKAKEIFQDLSPLEISIAEQKMLDEGMDEASLREYCDLHLKAMEEKKEKLVEKLPSNNPIRIAITEHDRILEFLEKLETIAEKIEEGRDVKEFGDKLSHISEHLVEAEKHHEREEEVLFPLLEEKDITGPPGIMREDHDRLWPKKLKLKELSERVVKGDLIDSEQLTSLAFELIKELRDHIYKENNILYPTVVENVEDDSEWKKMKEEFDEIGYCCFSPAE